MLSTCFGLIPPRSLLALFWLCQIPITNIVCATTNTYSFMMAMFSSCNEKFYTLLIVCNVIAVWRRRLWYNCVMLKIYTRINYFIWTSKYCDSSNMIIWNVALCTLVVGYFRIKFCIHFQGIEHSFLIFSAALINWT
jgi:hypothetical protein